MPVDLRAARLDAAIRAAGVPIHGLALGGSPPSTVRVDFNGATSGQQTTAQGIVDGFDYSAGAQMAWEQGQTRNGAKAKYDELDLYGRVLRAVVATIVDELNILRQQIVGVATVSAWDPANLADSAGLTRADITVTGAAFGDAVDVCAPYSLQGILCTGYVHAANTIGIRLQNETGGAINLAAGNWQVIVRRHVALPNRTLAQARTTLRNKVDADT